MKKFRDILVTDSAKFDVEEWDKRELFHNYERLRSYVIGNSGGLDFDFFTRPKRGAEKNEIIWQSEIFDDDPVPLSSLSGDEYNRYKALLQDKVKILTEYAGKLKKSDNQWGKMLEKALSNGGDNFVFCGEGKIAVTAWSMKPKPSPPEKPFIKNEGNPPPFNEQKDFNDEDEEISERQPVGDQRPVVDQHPDGEQLITTPDRESADNDFEFLKTSEPVKPEKTIDSPNIQADNLVDGQSPIPSTAPPDNHESVPPVNPSSVSPDNRSSVSPISRLFEPPVVVYGPPPSAFNGDNNRNDGDSRNGNNQNGNNRNRKKCSWWKWFLYILAALFLIFLLFSLLKKCSPTGGLITPVIPVLPKEPGILPPINDDDIGLDEDSITYVVTNKLNILLEEPDLDGFARDFKKLYPGDNYSVVYYDTIVRRLQIQVPKDEKNIIRQELPQRMSQYHFIIYDEALFESNFNPNDPALTDAKKRWYLDAVKAITAWDVTQGDPNIIVAIVDDGFDLSHPEIKDRVYKPYNVISKNNQITYLPEQYGIQLVDHGTHTSGTAIGQGNNNIGSLGIASKCKYMPVQVAFENGKMSTTSVMDGVLYAIYQGADVINISLGIAFKSDISSFLPEYMQLQMIENKFLEEEKVWNEIYKIAEKYNAVIVYAAGNENILTGIDPTKRSDYCIHVSAVDPKLQKAKFSNWGAQSTISAPGVDIYNAVFGNNYAYLDGTSMAAPIVTGGVALMKSLDKNMRARDIINLLQTTGLPIFSLQKIGNLIQLDRALSQINKGNNPNRPVDDCDMIGRKIDSLTRIIEQLIIQCPQYGQRDTLKLKDVIENPETLNGLWKSTTTLYNTSKERVEVYLEFNNGRGRLLLVEENGKTCEAPISVTIKGNSMEIIQEENAVCVDGTSYRKYLFLCRADRNGNAECEAVSIDNKLDKVVFNLIKIR